MATRSQTITLPSFIAELRRVPEEAFSRIDAVQQFLVDHPVDPVTLEPYLFWDLQHYTRNLIDKTPLYELIAICWEVGQASSIHNHDHQNCWMAAPVGKLIVQNYRLLSADPGSKTCQIEKTNKVEMTPAHPVAVNPEAPVHKVLNPREWGSRAVSLHIYSRPFNRCVVFSEEQQKYGDVELSYTSEYGVPKERAVR